MKKKKVWQRMREWDFDGRDFEKKKHVKSFLFFLYNQNNQNPGINIIDELKNFDKLYNQFLKTIL